jgi:hypothetical protein
VKARLFAVWFESRSRQYERLARVLETTARRWCPDWDVSVVRLPPPGLRGSQADVSNHYKLAAWAQEVFLLPDGERLLLVDADTAVTGSLDGIWDEDFDIAYTARPAGSRYPLNAGVIAVRGGWRARAFFVAWVAFDACYLRDAEARRPWRQSHGGQNQASLGATLHQNATLNVCGGHGAFVAALPCARWNCEDTTWSAFSGDTRIVHVKGALRMAALQGWAAAPEVDALARMWLDLDHQVSAHEAVA